MIALIRIDKGEALMEKTIADKLGLQYEEIARVGIGEGGKIKEMHSSDYYKDELKCLDAPADLYEHKGEEKQIYPWYIHKRPKEGVEYVKILDKPQLVSLETFAAYCTIPFRIEQAVTMDQGLDSLLTKINEVETKLTACTKSIDQQNHFNNRCQVHIGNNLIATYNDLLLKEDCCTDELQGALNGGWRIIACCPQPDQRRPDYILGRFNPEQDVQQDYAKRD